MGTRLGLRECSFGPRYSNAQGTLTPTPRQPQETNNDGIGSKAIPPQISCQKDHTKDDGSEILRTQITNLIRGNAKDIISQRATPVRTETQSPPPPAQAREEPLPSIPRDEEWLLQTVGQNWPSTKPRKKSRSWAHTYISCGIVAMLLAALCLVFIICWSPVAVVDQTSEVEHKSAAHPSEHTGITGINCLVQRLLVSPVLASPPEAVISPLRLTRFLFLFPFPQTTHTHIYTRHFIKIVPIVSLRHGTCAPAQRRTWTKLILSTTTLSHGPEECYRPCSRLRGGL